MRLQNGFKWLVLAAMCLLKLVQSIDSTAVNLAVPVIATEFFASLTGMQWVINAFFILPAVVQIIGGRLGDSYGHKKIFLLNLFLLIISSLGAGISENENSLIIFRALQGISIGIASPLTFVLICEAFSKEQQAFAISFFVATFGIGQALGAPLGGLFVHTIGWRWIFYINIPIGIICYILTKLYSPSKPAHKKPLCWTSATLLLLALLAITFSLNQVQNWGFVSVPFISIFSLGLFCIFFLYQYEKKQSHPLVEFSLFLHRNFSLNSALRVILQIIFLGLLFFIPLYLQNISGISALFTGLLILIMTFTMSIISPPVGKWVNLKGSKLPNIFSMGFFLVGSIVFLFLQPQPNFGILIAGLLCLGTATAIGFISTTHGALADASKEKMGAASGLFFTISWLSCAIGVSITGTIIGYQANRIALPQLQSLHLSSYQIEQALHASKGLTPVLSLKEKMPFFENLQEICSSTFIQAIQMNVWIFLCLSATGLLLSFFLKHENKEALKKIKKVTDPT